MCRPAILIYWNGADLCTLFLSSLELLMQCRPFSRGFTLKGGQGWSQHDEPNPPGELTPNTNSVFPLRLHLQKVYSLNFSWPPTAKPKNNTSLSFLHISKNMWFYRASAQSYTKCRRPLHQPFQGKGEILVLRPFPHVPKSCSHSLSHASCEQSSETNGGGKKESLTDSEWCSSLMSIRITWGPVKTPFAPLPPSFWCH